MPTKIKAPAEGKVHHSVLCTWPRVHTEGTAPGSNTPLSLLLSAMRRLTAPAGVSSLSATSSEGLPLCGTVLVNHSVAWDLGKLREQNGSQGPAPRQKVCLESAHGCEEEAGEETHTKWQPGPRTEAKGVPGIRSWLCREGWWGNSYKRRANSRFCFQRPFVTQVMDS